MKQHLLLTSIFVILCSVTIQLSAQISISTDNSPADNSAMLDVKSTNKGVVLPRMTKVEMNAIVNPASGLMVFCTDCIFNSSGSLTIFLNGSWNIINMTNCNLEPPVAGSHIPSPLQIVWNWNPSNDASGYKWNTIDDYTTAVDMSTNTTKTETGLTISTTYTRFVWAYNSCGTSTSRTLMCQTLDGFYIGQSYGGGIIFYIDFTGQHGLIAAPSDQSTGTEWGCYSLSIPGTSTFITSGQTNTTAIVNGCSTSGIAAKICNDLVLNGYDDWFLPSRDELNQMSLQKNVIGGFAPYYYWSSSEIDVYYAWSQHVNTGTYSYSTKNNPAHFVRAIRAF